MSKKLLLAVCFLGVVLGESTYRQPPKAVLDVLRAPATPAAIVSPARTHLLLAEPNRNPPIAEVAAPMLRLAGRRINPRTNGAHLAPSLVSLTLVRIDDGAKTPIPLPPDVRAASPRWSPDGSRFAFTAATSTATELWIAELASLKPRRIEASVNAATGAAFQWMPDGRALLVETVPTGRGAPPQKPASPDGPNVQASIGRSGPVRTFQDLLTSAHDEALYEYYATSQLALIDAASGKKTPIGRPANFGSVEPAPDGKHLLVERIHRPYSWLHPDFAFPRDVEVWDLAGAVLFTVARQPLADQVPIDGVRTGPRSIEWKPSEPAALVWVVAMDGGNPKEQVPHRDRIVMLRAPFRGEPVELAKTEHRTNGLDWLEKSDLGLIRDSDRNRRWMRTFLFDGSHAGAPGKLLWSRSVNDRYKDAGTPVRSRPGGGGFGGGGGGGPFGGGRSGPILRDGDMILLNGAGASPGGDRPFLDRYNVRTGESKRLFHSDDSGHETVIAPLDNRGEKFLTIRESPSEPPNFYVRGADGSRRALTTFTDPAPELRRIKKQLVSYKRADGVPLSFTLYLPPDYKEGTRLPTVVWAYPREFNDPDTAGQVVGSPRRFTRIPGMSHLFFLLRGYAVLDDASMPVVGDPETVNNTYVEQIVMNARAAIDKAVEMGVTDRNRVGVGGHSYGAFMTANLLAHSDLFKAGIARSGAYNRTLTPFGFQSERRTLWEATETYLRMSPFMNAHKIKEPLLLIHGEADNNSGTFPIQSERMYQAMRGHGGHVRLVMLPHESHGYAARESVEHTLAEMIDWFDQHVKGETR